MSRSTRSKQLSTKLSTKDCVLESVKTSTRSSKVKNTTTKLRPIKGSKNNKLSNVHVLFPLLSPVLRDRTNLTKEPTTKLDVLKKGIEDTESAVVKMVTEKRTTRTRAIKPTVSQGAKNIRDTAIKVKKITATTKNEENTQRNTIRTRVMRNAAKNETAEVKSSVPKAKKTKEILSQKQSKLTVRTRTQRNSVSSDEWESPERRISEDNAKASKKLPESRKTTKSQSIKRSSRLSENKIDNKLTNVNDERKFFRSKLKTPRAVSTLSKVSQLKKPVMSKTRKNTMKQTGGNKNSTSPRLSTSVRFRQATLQESFAKQPKVLRPRKILKNYCDESQVVKKTKKENDADNIDEKKGPVYKSKNNTDEKTSIADKDKVYDFIFDLNDSKERRAKKRKKRVIRKPPAKKAKIAEKETKTKSTLATESELKKVVEVPPAIPKSAPVIDKPPAINKPVGKNNVKNNNKLTTVTVEVHPPPFEIIHEDHEPLTTNEIPESIIDTNVAAGPQIISDEILNAERRINLTVTPLQPRSIQDKLPSSNEPNKFNLRPSMQLKTMMNASLLRKSLSPITKECSNDNLDPASPWRPPSISTFSHIKNIFQSTPQGKKFTTLLGKPSFANGVTRQMQNNKITKIFERNDENVNVPSLTKKSPEKIQTNTSKSPRKFGTVISNINNNSPIKQQSMQINTSKSPRKFGTVISNINESLSPKTSPVMNEHTRLLTNIGQSIVSNSINTSLSPVQNETLNDKENFAPKNKSPRKSPHKKTNNILRVSSSNSENIKESPERNELDEVFEPQPGPSGLQKSNPSKDMWNLKQSSLNQFLNLPDMPSSTKITTAHGIFNDVDSTPINAKTKKKIVTESLGVNNAFGFDDDTDDTDISPINQIDNELKSRVIPVFKKSDNATAVKPIRFSIGEMKKTLATKVINENIEKINQNCEKVPVDNEKRTIAAKEDIIQAISFSDTFDNLDHEIDKENIEEIPLFVDIEPVHFNQPPRYSYGHKRKRNLSFNSSEEMEENEESEETHKRSKKKRIGKAEREQKKILDKWAKSMNNTFEEIDHFDLLVE